MIASELISKTLAPLRTSDTGEEALTIMNIYHVKHLPIVNNEQLLGVVSEEDVLVSDMGEAVGSYNLSLRKPYVNQKAHLFEVMSMMAENKLSVIPVIDDDENYLGLITQEDLIQFYATSFSFAEPGSIMVLETKKRDYSLAKISRIVEEESASILSCFLSENPDSESVYVTLKINKQDLQKILASFERYDYTIKGSFSEEEYIDELKERYDSLMNYLNV
jgi:CBS domain-containing protein